MTSAIFSQHIPSDLSNQPSITAATATTSYNTGLQSPRYYDICRPDAYQTRHSSINSNTNSAFYCHQEVDTSVATAAFLPPSIALPIYNDHDQYTTHEVFEAIVQDYLRNLSFKKRDKALIDQARYSMILQVLRNPRNTSVSTAQFRFWVKKMFRLYSSIGNRCGQPLVCHDGKPVAMREQLYDILVGAHREAHHGGRDKTSALVRKRYSWIPKELIARFVRHCPFCISRRNGTSLQHQLETYFDRDDFIDRQRGPSLKSNSSCGTSTASHPEEVMLMAAATASHQKRQQHQSILTEGYRTDQHNFDEGGVVTTSSKTGINDNDTDISGITTPKSRLMTYHTSLYNSSIPCGNTDIAYMLDEPMTFQTAAPFCLSNSNIQLNIDNTTTTSNQTNNVKTNAQIYSMIPAFDDNTLQPTSAIKSSSLDHTYYSPSLSPSSSTTSAFPPSPAYSAYYDRSEKDMNCHMPAMNGSYVQHKSQCNVYTPTSSIRSLPHTAQQQLFL